MTVKEQCLPFAAAFDPGYDVGPAFTHIAYFRFDTGLFKFIGNPQSQCFFITRRIHRIRLDKFGQDVFCFLITESRCNRFVHDTRASNNKICPGGGPGQIFPRFFPKK